MGKKYIVVIAFFVGVLMGMMQNQLTVPTISSPDTPYYHGLKGNNQVSLAINVDWGEEYIGPMLEVFKEKDIKVTFFVTGNWVRKFPDLLKEMFDAGHEIGNHGYTHAHPKQLSEADLIALIKKNEELIYNIIGKKTNLFAPPYGEVDGRICRIAHNIGYKTIMWSADTIDWQRPAPQIIVQRAVNKVSDGGIILMHPTKVTLEALPEIISRLENRGFKLVSISQLLGIEN